MNTKKSLIVLLLLAILVSACSSAATPEYEVIVEPGVVQKEGEAVVDQVYLEAEEPQEEAAEYQLPQPTSTGPIAEQPMPTPMPEPTATVIQEPVLITDGDFYGADDFHQGKGDAFIYQNPDGSYFLRFENFEVTNGPQLHVILGVEPNPFNHDTLGDYLDLGPLKGNIGDQNYVIPAGTDLEAYGSVVIYCVPFRAIFAIAPIR